ncbi:hypothetical protein HDU79_009713 [Rhizoclosmatium sp. JEL0117]|nr:hypothetical protein HDU79_009713 [Rhizoclosmatium sp. JEL0117]
MVSNNATSYLPPSASIDEAFVNPAQSAIIIMTFGLTAEVSITGLISTICRSITTTSTNFRSTALFLSVFNFLTILYNVMLVYDFLAQKSEYVCVNFELYQNVVWHVLVMMFDVFILFKTYYTSRLKKYRVVLAAAITIIVTSRFIWAVYDIATSHGEWNVKYCSYYQNSISNAGFNITDIICDIFATTVTLIMNWNLLVSQESSLIQVTVIENIVRSVTILSINIAAMYVGMMFVDPFTTWLVFSVQTYLYTQCMNLDTFAFYFRRTSNELSGKKRSCLDDYHNEKVKSVQTKSVRESTAANF